MQDSDSKISLLQSQFVETNFRKILNIIAISFFLLLVVVLLVFGYTPQNDTEGYIQLARTCLAVHQPYPCMEVIAGQPFIWNIGQINLIALSLWLFGSVVPVLWLMCIMKAATLWLVGHIGRHFFGAAAGVCAALLYMLYPNNWGQSTMLLSEIPMVCLGLLAIFLVLRTHSLAVVFLAGIIMAVANWFRPVAMVYAGSLFLYYIIFRRQDFVRRMLPMLAGYLLAVVAIGTSCYMRTGYFVYQSETLWFNMSEAIYETSSEPHYDSEMFPKGTPRYIEDMASKTCFECDSIWRERSLAWLKAHPADYMKKIPERMAWLMYNDIDNVVAFKADKSNAADNNITLPYRSILTQISSLSGIQMLALAAMACYFVLLVLAAVGIIRLCRRRRWADLFLPLFIVAGGALAIVIAVHGEPRFKAPLMPFLFMLAAAATGSLQKTNEMKLTNRKN